MPEQLYPQQRPFASDLVQRLQYLEMVGRIFSVERDYEWIPEQRRLSIMPAPRAGSIQAGVAVAIVEVSSSDVDTRLLDPQGHEFFRRKMLIEAKRTLGNIRNIYDSFPTVGGDRSMNGNMLIQQAEQEQTRLDQDIMNWIKYTGIIVG